MSTILPQTLLDAEEWLRRGWYESTDVITRVNAQQVREAIQRHREGHRVTVPKAARCWLTTAATRGNVHARVLMSWLMSEGILPAPEQIARVA